MQPKSHTVFHLSVSSALVAGVLTMILGACILFAHCSPAPTPPERSRLFPRIGSGDAVGDIGSAAATREAKLESTYGPVNKAALTETKEGLFSRVKSNIQHRRSQRQSIRSARTVQRCQPAVTNVQTSCAGPQFTQPVYRVPSVSGDRDGYVRQPTLAPPLPPARPAGPSVPLNQPRGPLDIQPSKQQSPADCPTGECPLMQSIEAAPAEDPADQPPALPDDFVEPVKSAAPPQPPVAPQDVIAARSDGSVESDRSDRSFESLQSAIDGDSDLLIFPQEPSAADDRRHPPEPTAGYTPPLAIRPSL